jgi:Concanavalin A-like lectin/glucanases superfamily
MALYRHALILGLVLVGLLPLTPAAAATRLGLHHTQEEVWCWKQRAGIDAQGSNGITCPIMYRIAGDVQTNSPGDWTQVVNNAAAIPGTPTLENWAGNTSGQPWSPNVVCTGDNQSGGAECAPNQTLGQKFLDAAFVTLVDPTGHNYAAAIRTGLLAQVATPGTDFTNAALWPNIASCAGVDSRMTIPNWLTRYAYAYSYVRDHAVFSAGERLSIDTWFSNAAFWFARCTDNLMRGGFPNRNTEWDTTVKVSGLYPTDARGSTPNGSRLTHYDCGTNARGHLAGGWLEVFNNRQAALIRFGAIGASLNGTLPNDAQSLRWAKMWFTEWVTYGTFATGMLNDYYRWSDATFPSQGWLYTSFQIGAMAAIADVLARAGDTSLYDYTTSSGKVWASNPSGLNANTNGGPKSLLQTMLRHASFVPSFLSGVPNWHGNQDYDGYTVNCADARYRFGPRDDRRWPNPATVGRVDDSMYAMANMYYKNSTLTQAYTRAVSGAPAYPSAPDALWYAWSGDWGTQPGSLFMWGQLDGVLNPFSTAGTPPTCTVTGPTPFPVYHTATTPITTLQGTASDDAALPASSVTWANDRGGSGTATGTTSWTIPSASLQTGDNVFTVTVTDADTQPGTCQLVVRYQTAADATSNLEMHLPLDEGTGTTPQDATANNHDGTFAGTPTWVAGILGAGAVLFDSASDWISVAGLLTAPAALTLEARIKFAALPAGSGDVISLGDHVALRVSSTVLNGFYYTGTAWNQTSVSVTLDTAAHDVAYMVAAGEQWLYLDGVPLAYTTHAAAPNYTGLGANTIIGAHGNGSTTFPFPGTLDNVRVWTRALTRPDLLAAIQATPLAPLVTITSPTSSDTYATGVASLTTLGGTASDADGTVTSVTWSCAPACGSGTATGAASWSVPSITLPAGASTITVTATDNASQTGQDVLTVTYTAPVPPTGLHLAPHQATGHLLQR